MKTTLRFIIRFLLVIFGFLFTFSLPFILGINNDRITINFQAFGKMVINNFHALVQTNDANYLGSLKVLPITESYQYSMTILTASLFTVFFLAMLAAICIMISPAKVQNRLRNGVNFFEAVPDLLVIFLLQFFVLYLLHKTGLRIFQLYGLFGAKPYFIPVVTVSFLPFFLLLQFLLKVMTEEQNQLYVLYCKAKGISMVRILFLHIFRNIFPVLFLQIRTIVWVMLANLYLIEYMFNLNGFTKILLKIIFIQDIPSLVICLLMFAAPLAAVETCGWMLTRRLFGKETAGL